jgi:hypothetical protein
MPQQPTTLFPSNLDSLLSPLLASLPTASISPSPPTALLPLLSPILRQRVQILSSASQDPWLPLLTYNETDAPKLEKVVNNSRFEPHPVSNEVEVDWESEVEVGYKRVDEETLHALVKLREFELGVKCVWCVNDEAGGGDGWRIGEVLVLEEEKDEEWEVRSIELAEAGFASTNRNATQISKVPVSKKEEEEEEDDDYWAQYDNTPAQTPGPNDTRHNRSSNANVRNGNGATDEDEYYAQYASVQPAMDNHDPDEAQENGHVESSLGKEEVTSHYQAQLSSQHESELRKDSEAWGEAQKVEDLVLHPRPSSSQSSGSDTVAKLEKLAQDGNNRESSELGIKQHIGTSVKSLWRLAKVVGMEREEFERIVRTELDLLGMMDEDD